MTQLGDTDTLCAQRDIMP